MFISDYHYHFIAMSYLAVKKVKGRFYAYRQESYREGGKVRTRTIEYLGAVNLGLAHRVKSGEVLDLAKDGDGTLIASLEANGARKTLDHFLASEAEQRPTKTLDGTAIKTTSLRSSPTRHLSAHTQMEVNGEQVLVNRNTGVIVEHYGDAVPKAASLKPLRPFAQSLILPNLQDYGVSTSAIHATHKRFGRRLAEMQINPSLMSDVKIEYGHPNRFRANRDGSYTVQFSRKSENKRHPINKTELWKNYRQALAHSYMDAIEKGHSRLYEDMRVAFDHHYRESQKLALQAINLSQDPMMRVVLSLQLKLWHRLPEWTQNTMTSEELGQFNLNRQNGWRVEATEILAEIQKSGWDGLDKRMRNNRTKLKSRITKRKHAFEDANMMGRLTMRLSGKRRKMMHEIRESEIKLQAMEQLQHRMDFLKRHLPQ